MQEAIGYDGYNATITGEQSATLGVNCGMTTGRNGVLVKAYGVVAKGNGECWLMEEKHTALSAGGGMAGQGYPCIMTEAIGFDAYNQSVTGEVSKPLTHIATDTDHVPVVFIQTEQKPVYTLKIRGGARRRRQGSIDTDG